MHKWSILTLGLCVGGVLFAVLARQVAAEGPREIIPVEPEPVGLPCAVRDTQMTVRETAVYEGPFWEDGSGEEVSDVFALVVENTGGTMILQGQITLETETGIMEFVISWLPPDAVVLVPEKNRANSCGGQILECNGWNTTIYPELSGAVTATAQGMGNLVFTNHTTQPIAQVEAWYRSYDAQSEMYIGGRADHILIEDLMSGEERLVSPFRYAKGYSKVVCILLNASKE